MASAVLQHRLRGEIGRAITWLPSGIHTIDLAHAVAVDQNGNRKTDEDGIDTAVEHHTRVGTAPIVFVGERVEVESARVGAALLRLERVAAHQQCQPEDREDPGDAASKAPPGSLRDQFERASVSIVLNIGEGAGRRSRKDKARFYSMARGSAMECGAVLAILGARQLAEAAELDRAKRLLVRIVEMLSALERRMGP